MYERHIHYAVWTTNTHICIHTHMLDQVSFRQCEAPVRSLYVGLMWTEAPPRKPLCEGVCDVPLVCVCPDLFG